MRSPWIDFKALKAAVPIRAVLERYGFLDGLTEKGHKLSGPCPIHQGGPNSSSFHVDTKKNIWKCFSTCDAGGNALDLVMKVEGCDIRQAAEKLTEWFGLTFERNEGKVGSKETAGDETPAKPQGDADAGQISPPGNPPLERPLTNLNPNHPYLARRRVNMKTIEHFGIGHCTRGLMRGRIAIPIHNERGELVAYAGRAVDDELARERGRYRLPEGFRKSYVLFNLYRAKEHAERGLTVVEGFFDVFRVHEAGFRNVVALMGTELSEQHEQLLLDHTDRLALMFDGDEAGQKCLRQFYGRLRRRMYLKEIHLSDGEQPDSLSDQQIRSLLT